MTPPVDRRVNQWVGAPKVTANRALALILVISGLAWFSWLRPEALGGDATVLIVRGTSMEPTYRAGDLIIGRSAAEYQVGDIVVFGVPDEFVGAGTLIIHRIIGGDGASGYLTRGDNATSDDEWHPTNADVVARARLRVPGLGKTASLFHSRSGIAMLTGIIAGLIVFEGSKPDGSKQRRATRPRRGGRPGRSSVAKTGAPGAPEASAIP